MAGNGTSTVPKNPRADYSQPSDLFSVSDPGSGMDPGSGFKQDSGSVSRIGIQIQEGKNDPQK
jgi:hypothetical protein